jgi:hypothetical protein
MSALNRCAGLRDGVYTPWQERRIPWKPGNRRCRRWSYLLKPVSDGLRKALNFCVMRSDELVCSSERIVSCFWRAVVTVRLLLAL